ncbi:MAG: Sir2 family NAD-dependent protein deacetylase [Isosphaeraceae bacterium]
MAESPDRMDDLERTREALESAEALVIGAGAGMGVDSGLPDFRGVEGFWEAYPPFARLGLRFEELANPRWFASDPALAWGFYGHRRNLYRATQPHEGFSILRRWAERMPRGYFVVTSNVDGHFQKAGFRSERVVEVHGAIDWCQCLNRCGIGIYKATKDDVAIDPETFRAAGPLPSCPTCEALARPNILMFGDGGWDAERTSAQYARLSRWLGGLDRARVVVVECGAGRSIPTIRLACEDIAGQFGGLLVRINPREPQVPRGHIGIASAALEALRTLDRRQAGAG